jgi:hypothetical protein
MSSGKTKNGDFLRYHDDSYLSSDIGNIPTDPKLAHTGSKFKIPTLASPLE